MKVVKKYFKDNKQYFDFVRKHPELKVDSVYMTKKSIVAIISKRRGRPKKVGGHTVDNSVKSSGSSGGRTIKPVGKIGNIVIKSTKNGTVIFPAS